MIRMAESDEKKERVLHTRVSSSLDDEIRERASKLGMSVSNLVRNVLTNALGLVEDIVSDSGRVAQAAVGQQAAQSIHQAGESARPVGWRELVLNVNAICAECNRILARGQSASMAVFRGTGPDTFLCGDCLKAIGAGEDSDAS